MVRNKRVTKKQLEKIGITNVTEDGRIFVGDKEVKHRVRQSPYKYKESVKYYYVAIYLNHDNNRNNYFQCGVSRVVYAWFNGEVKKGYDIDHIDNDPSNNCIHNLKQITRLQNNRKKKISRNQYTYNLTDEEILEKRKSKKTYYNRKTHKVCKKK